MPPPRRRTRPETTNAAVRDKNGKLLRTLVGAAQLLSGPTVERVPQRIAAGGRGWHPEAWDLYDEVGELHFGANAMAAALSRVNLIAARPSDDPGAEPETLEDGPAAELVAEFAGGPAGQEQFLNRAGLHLLVTGDSLLLVRDTEDDGRLFGAYSTEELTQKGDRWVLDDGSGQTVDLDADAVVGRIWRPHPRRLQWPDSSVRSALPVLRELRGLTMHVSAQVDSRLAGAGVWILPNSITAAPSPGSQAAPEGEDPILSTLMDAMITPIRDRDSAAAVVPVLFRVPDETLQGWNPKDSYVRFDGPLDAQAKELRDEAIRRLALGLDMPPELVLGLGEVNHWSAWAIDEAQIRLFVAPLAAIVAHGVTVNWLRPSLDDDAADVMVWFDTSTVQLRPDRSMSARDLFDRLALSAEALRRENGFGDDDAPQGDELLRQIALNAVTSAPSLAPLLLPLLGFDLGAEPTAAPVTGGPAPAPEEETPQRSLPERPAPDEAAVARDSLAVAVCDVAVHRALEIAGKRLRDTGGRGVRAQMGDTPAHMLHTRLPAIGRDLDRLLDGAWSMADDVPHLAPLVPYLDCYTRRLLLTSQPHNLAALQAFLAEPEEARCA